MTAVLRNQPIGLRLMTGFGLIIAALGLVVGWTTLSLFGALDRFQDYREVAQLSAAAGEVRAEFKTAQLAAEAYILTVDYGEQAEAEKRLKLTEEWIGRAKAMADEAADRERLAAIETEVAGFAKLFRDTQGNAFLQQEMSVRLREAGRRVNAASAALADDLARRLERVGPQVHGSVEGAARRALWLTALAILAGAAVAWLLSGSLAAPIRAMTGAMARIAGGDLAAPVPAQDRKDEIGAMARALAVFKANAEEVARLQEERSTEARRSAEDRRQTMGALAAQFESSVKAMVDRVGAASRDLATSADALIRTASAAHEETGQVARRAAQSAANVSTVASASEELSASIGEIAEQAGRSAEVARHAEARSRETSRTVTELSEAAQRIGQVVTLISTIAEQTNLLALNATIEAARAGEAGRGFAVVAQEVKSLAGQTARATQEIGAQINGIQNATDDAVTAIRSVGEAIAEVSAIAATIAASVEEQRAVVQEISRSTTEVSVSTQAVNGSIEQVREGAVTTMSAAERSRQAAQTLGREAEQLDEEVRSFLARVRAG
jgi:methyl-accepting chemotaxis protein